MTTTVTIVTTVEKDHYLITGQVNPGGTLPQEIFIYENNGEPSLGTFWGTCSVSELGSIQIFTGTAIPIFGNRFVRSKDIKILVDLNAIPSAVVTALINNVKSLSASYNAQTELVQNFTIT